jgi:hypothetical protein
MRVFIIACLGRGHCLFSYRHRYETLNYAIFQPLNVQRTSSARARNFRKSNIGTIEILLAWFTVKSLKNKPIKEVCVTFRQQGAGIYRSALAIINAPSG